MDKIQSQIGEGRVEIEGLEVDEDVSFSCVVSGEVMRNVAHLHAGDQRSHSPFGAGTPSVGRIEQSDRSHTLP